MTRSEVVFFVNGAEHRVSGADAFLTLSTWLRQVQHQVGTKVVCEEGDCGACTVLVGRVEGKSLRYVPINSCIQLVAQLDGTHVITVEGLSRTGELSLMQEKMMECHGAQCGYCTPGFVVAMSALLEEKKKWDEQDVRDALTGNLCRCTGYSPIIEAAMAASGKGAPSANELYPENELAAAIESISASSLAVEANDRRFFAPASLGEALQIKANVPGVVIVQGGTDVGVLANKRAFAPAALMTLAHVRELGELKKHGGSFVAGANVTLAQLEHKVEKDIPALYEMLRIFGAPQIRNAGTIAGNIANGSPIADTLPFFFVSGASVELASVRGTRSVDIARFYKGYKTLDLEPDELIVRVVIPVPEPKEIVKLYKVSKRRDLDISAFGAAFRMKIRDGVMSDVRVAFGGVAATVIRLPQIEELLEGKPITEERLRGAGERARTLITPLTDVRGSADFRLQLAENIFMKFYDDVTARP